MYIEELDLEVADDRLSELASQKKMTLEQVRQGMVQEGLQNPKALSKAIRHKPDQYRRPTVVERTGRGLKKGFQNITENPMESVVNPLAQGIAGAGDYVVGYPAQVLNNFLPENRQFQLPHNGSGTAYNRGSMIGDIATFGAAGGAVGGAAKALSKAPGATRYVGQALTSSSMLPKIGRNALGAGLYEASKEPGEGRTKEQMFRGGATIAGGIDTAAALFNKLRPFKAIAEGISPEAMSKIDELVEHTKGLQIPLGDVIQSRGLKWLYDNLIEKVPFSGSEKAARATKEKLEKEAKDIFSSYSHGVAPEDLEDAVVTELKKQHKFHQTKKDKLYDIRNEIAEKEGFNLDLSEFGQRLHDLRDVGGKLPLSEIDPRLGRILQNMAYPKSPKERLELAGHMDTVRNALPNNSSRTLEEEYISSGANKTAKNLRKEAIEAIKSPEDIARGLEEKFNKGRDLSLSEITFIKRHLYDTAARLSRSPEKKSLEKIHQELASTLGRNIEKEIMEKGSPSLIHAQEKANDYYANDYLPYTSKLLKPYLKGDKPPSAIVQDIVKTGRSSDKKEPIIEMLAALSPKGRDLFKGAYLKRALTESGEINPSMTKTLLSAGKLGLAQFKALLSNKEQEALRRFGTRAYLGKEALESMLNPKTGHTLTTIAAPLAFLGGAAKMGSHSANNNPGFGALVGLLGGTLAAKAGNKILTNETARKLIVDQIKKAAKGKESEKFRKTIKQYMLTHALPGEQRDNKDRELMNLHLTKRIGE